MVALGLPAAHLPRSDLLLGVAATARNRLAEWSTHRGGRDCFGDRFLRYASGLLSPLAIIL